MGNEYNEVTDRWIEQIVGRNWEIYWARESTDSPKEHQDDENDGVVKCDGSSHDDEDAAAAAEHPSKRRKREKVRSKLTTQVSAAEVKEGGVVDDDDDVDEEDWYAGHIKTFLGYETNKDGREIQNRPVFQVLFVGDDELYEMCVQPDILRPCSRTWIKRSLALLHAHNNNFKVSLKTPLTNQLPSDTRRLQDEQDLLKIQQSLEGELKPVQKLSTKLLGKGTSKAVVASAATFPEWNELQRIREMILLIRQQIYLRSWLIPTEADEPVGRSTSSSTSLDEDQPPSEAYIRFLVDNLESAARCCLWYDRCYVLLFRIYNAKEEQENGHQLLGTDEIFKIFAEDGRQRISELLSLDPSFAVFKRKRKNTATATIASPKSSRRTKRRRTANGMSEFFAEEESSGEKMLTAEVKDFRSAAFVKQLVERLAKDDQRWFSLSIGRMFRALSSHVVVPIVNWEEKSKFYLGESDVLRIQDADGNSISGSEEDNNDDDDDGDSSNDQESSDWFSIADIESLLDMSKPDCVISKCDFSAVTARLEGKLRDIATFETQCWETIEGVLDEEGAPHNPNDDAILKRLNLLIDTTKQKDSAVWNVDPLGNNEVPLSRSMLDDAMENRKWFLDLKHAESVRERSLFIEVLLTRRLELPDLPYKKTAENSRSNNRFAALDSRIHVLSSLLSENATLFDRQSTTLGKMEGDIQSMKPSLTSMLEELHKVRIVHVVEEMIVTRMDVGSWLERAEQIIGQTMPKYEHISEIKAGLDKILTARSPQRSELTSSLRPCVKADNEVRMFAERDLHAFCEATMNTTISLYAKSSAWKERCDSIFTALRFHGNQAAWSANASGPVRNTGMVDLKRIEDLLQEYCCLETSIETEYNSLRVAYEECVQWSDNITDLLFNNDVAFADVYAAVEAANQPEGRPKGIIVHPTRQVLDTVLDMLRWHGAVKALVQNRFGDMGAAYQLLMEGIEIVELYGNGRKAAKDNYLLKPDKMRELLRQRMDSRKSMRSFSRVKLESHHITDHLLGEMVTECRDRTEGFPLFSLLQLSWRIEAENFAENFLGGDDQKIDCSFESAISLKAAMPAVENPPFPNQVDFFNAPSQRLSDFFRLIDEADKTNQTITGAIAASRAALRDCLRNVDGVRSHAATLKDHFVSIKRDTTSPRNTLTLPRSVEARLDKEIKLFGWLLRAIQYPDVFRDDEESASLSSESAPPKFERMPFDVLVKLNENKPEMVSGMGDFTLVLLRLKELFEAANSWQDEVSNETLLSLRGGKRRNTPAGENGEVDEGVQKIDLARVAQLSASPILKKITMPREEAIRSMLENTKKFEVLLQDFIGKDYSGKYPDRIQLPASTSLIDDDGRFILLRLTGAPLFIELKSSIQSIASVADDVLADTPGKATFDWICKAVTWIEELSSCIDRDKIGHSQLSVEKSSVMDLLKMADAILLDVPDDLRRTLSKYGILVSTNKDGRLTVKSKKGAAHHSIGTTAIRWSPVLFEALKEDVGRTGTWEAKMKDLTERCKDFQTWGSSPVEAKDVINAYILAEEIAELQWEASELVVVPEKEMVDNGLVLQRVLASFIESHSTDEIKRQYAQQVLQADSAIAQDRGLLLDALLDRVVVVGGEIPDAVVAAENINDPLFRAAARNLISRGLEQGTTAIASDLDDTGDLIALCKVRAWEIEDSLFRFLQPKNDDKASPRYREKVRCLRRAFCDLCNKTLCLQVVCGEIDPEKLVRMTTEQLASPQIRRDREAIEARAKEKTILTRSLAKKEKDENIEKDNIDNCESKASETKTADGSAVSSNEEKDRATGLKNGEKVDNQKSDPEQPTEGNKVDPSTTTSKISKPVTRASARPPPPPSLADPLRVQPSVQNGLPHVLNASGSDKFTLTAANTMFTVSFVPKSVIQPNMQAILPQSLHDSGRTKVDEFIEFLSGKRNSSNWKIYILRLLPCSDADAREYKKFYKDFEGKERIAMFKLPNKNKLFLITPKFHKDVKDIIRLENASSTYGVLLLRS
ncbi:hypothetical protein ACA910_005752 [Epithemia clementina (nom. ined.)]